MTCVNKSLLVYHESSINLSIYVDNIREIKEHSPVLILERVKSIIDINNPEVLKIIFFPSRINCTVADSFRRKRMFPLQQNRS